jgi:hypothetical protein
MITHSDMASNAIKYYITHNGKRPGINVMSSQRFEKEFGKKENVYWNKVYRFDGHAAPSDAVLDILNKKYNLIEENINTRVYVYQLKTDFGS